LGNEFPNPLLFFCQFSGAAMAGVALHGPPGRVIVNQACSGERPDHHPGAAPPAADNQKKDGGLGEFIPPALPAFTFFLRR
jgi:hypothetical protein